MSVHFPGALFGNAGTILVAIAYTTSESGYMLIYDLDDQDQDFVFDIDSLVHEHHDEVILL